MNNYSLPVNRTKNRLKTDPTEYIFRQEEADECLKQLLILIKEWQFHYEMNCTSKILKLSETIHEKCMGLDGSHRSYPLVQNLVTTIMALTKMQQNQYQACLSYINFEIESNMRINRPEYEGKTILLKIIYLHKIAMSEWLKQLTQNPENVEAQRRNEYKNLKKVRVHRRKQSILSRRWEYNILDTLLIYQYQLIIKMIGQYQPAKATFLFQKGLKIASKVLGPDHHLTNILKSVTKIRAKTKRILKVESMKNSALQSFRKTNGKNKTKNSLYSKSPHSPNFSQISKNRIQSILSLPKARSHASPCPPVRNTSYGQSWINKKYFPIKETPEMKNLEKITQLYSKPKQKTSTKNLQNFSIANPIQSSEKWQNLMQTKQQKKKGGFIVNQESKIFNKSKLEQMLDDQNKFQDKEPTEKPKKESVFIPTSSIDQVEQEVKVKQKQQLNTIASLEENPARSSQIKKPNPPKDSKLQPINPEITLPKEKQDESSCQLI